MPQPVCEMIFRDAELCVQACMRVCVCVRACMRACVCVRESVCKWMYVCVYVWLLIVYLQACIYVF